MNNKTYILEDRAILYISGLDTKDFLQNLVSNDVNKVTENYSCFASLLTPQGKFLYDFIVVKHKSGYFIDCEKAQSKELFNQLKTYIIRSKVEILNLSNEFVVASFSYEKYLSMKGSKDSSGYTFKYREDPIILDPRNKKLGARMIINLEKLYLSLKKLELKNDKIENYYTHSHNLGIVPKDLNKLQNKIFGIECNFEELNGIDFKKGCYVGQENTARIKLKNKLSKRLIPIKILDGDIKIDEDIKNQDGIVGKILIDGKYPFALINIKKIKLDSSQVLNTNKAKIKMIINSYLLQI